MWLVDSSAWIELFRKPRRITFDALVPDRRKALIPERT